MSYRGGGAPRSEKVESAMTIMTPNAKGHERLSALASRYIDVASLPWVPTRFNGVDLKAVSYTHLTLPTILRV